MGSAGRSPYVAAGLWPWLPEEAPGVPWSGPIEALDRGAWCPATLGPRAPGEWRVIFDHDSGDLRRDTFAIRLDARRWPVRCLLARALARALGKAVGPDDDVGWYLDDGRWVLRCNGAVVHRFTKSAETDPGIALAMACRAVAAGAAS